MYVSRFFLKHKKYIRAQTQESQTISKNFYQANFPIKNDVFDIKDKWRKRWLRVNPLAPLEKLFKICLTTNDVISRISLTNKLLSFYYSFTIDMISMGKIIIHKYDVMQNSFPN